MAAGAATAVTRTAAASALDAATPLRNALRFTSNLRAMWVKGRRRPPAAAGEPCERLVEQGGAAEDGDEDHEGRAWPRPREVGRGGRGRRRRSRLRSGGRDAGRQRMAAGARDPADDLHRR